jgi:hypothetical protein
VFPESISRPLQYFSPLQQSAILWPGSPHQMHLGPLVIAPQFGGQVVVEARFGFVDWVLFQGVSGPFGQVVLPPVPCPKKPMDSLAAVFSNKSAL